jgi:hypothetical protein
MSFLNYKVQRYYISNYYMQALKCYIIYYIPAVGEGAWLAGERDWLAGEGAWLAGRMRSMAITFPGNG